MLSPNRSRAENRLTHVAPLRTRDENTRSHSPPYFARGKAPTAVSHHCFGCLRLHSARASCNCNLNVSGHLGSRHKLLAVSPRQTPFAAAYSVVRVRRWIRFRLPCRSAGRGGEVICTSYRRSTPHSEAHYHSIAGLAINDIYRVDVGGSAEWLGSVQSYSVALLEIELTAVEAPGDYGRARASDPPEGRAQP
jgi:hypothetical protein